ncbi:hypothetical protein BGX34_000183 [Mortierella sp. NVP85]|nr:hypothetical protein BGX34_000183 [Mortierella sp. NVP85]
MSFVGPPDTPLSPEAFYSQALATEDAGQRRRLFADARQSNPGSYQLWIKAAEIEEHWGADEARLEDLLTRGITVFKNPGGSYSGSGFGEPQPVTQHTWETEAATAESQGKDKTAKALRAAVEKSFA